MFPPQKIFNLKRTRTQILPTQLFSSMENPRSHMQRPVTGSQPMRCSFQAISHMSGPRQMGLCTADTWGRSGKGSSGLRGQISSRATLQRITQSSLSLQLEALDQSVKNASLRSIQWKITIDIVIKTPSSGAVLLFSCCHVKRNRFPEQRLMT